MKRSVMVGSLVALLLLGGGLAIALHFNAEVREKAQTMNSILGAFNESNRDVQEMKAVVNSHAEGSDRIHSMATAIPAMTAKMRAIDASRCPPDFQQALLRYRQAWEGLGEKMGHLPQTSLDALSDSFTGILFDNGSSKVNDQISRQNDELRAATNELEATALRYGARISVAN